MELEEKFFKSFFYPFLIGVIPSSSIVILFLFLFTNSKIDKITIQSIIDIEAKNSKIHLKSANVILTSMLLKIQSSLNEQILFYQRIAEKSKNIDLNKFKFQEDKLRCVYDFDQNFYNINKDYLEFMGYWYITNETQKFEDINNNKAKKQIISFSQIMQNLYSSYSSTSKCLSNLDYFFYFEETNLFISFPVLYDYINDYLGTFVKYESNPYWCTDEEGKVYTIYLTRCRDFYIDIQKTKTNAFDNNYLVNQNRKIFITNFYKQLDDEDSDSVYSICIQFSDPISNNKAFACCDVNQRDLISAFEEINSNLEGLFFIAYVGFNKVFFFPQENGYPKTITENIYKWNINYLLEEKTYFFNYIQKALTSNYNNQLERENNLFNEVYVNGNNSDNQYFL